MNFSEIFQINGQPRFSPDGTFLAYATMRSLVVRNAQTFKVARVFPNVQDIEDIIWSFDSEYIMCAMYKRATVMAFSLENPDWKCKIDEGLCGIVSACWSPDSRHILTVADFHLWVAVWSLVNRSVSHFKKPKAIDPCLAFSPDGMFMALTQSEDSKDSITVISCSTWTALTSFECDLTSVSGLLWCPDSSRICVWDCPLYYKVKFFSIDGRCLWTYEAYEWELGIKAVSWAPSSQFLAVGSYDQKIRLLNTLTWQFIVDFSHHCNSGLYSSYTTYQEVCLPDCTEGIEAPLRTSRNSKYVLLEECLTSLPTLKPDHGKPNPKIGIGLLKFSADGRYLAARNDIMPKVLWIWDMSRLDLKALLIQTNSITDVEWDPTQDRLAIATGTRNVFFWTPVGCVSVGVPSDTNFQVVSLLWQTAGKVLSLFNKLQMMVCLLTPSSS